MSLEFLFQNRVDADTLLSAHLLQRPPPLTTNPAHRDVRFERLDRYQPVARIGYSLYLYRFG